MDTHLALPSFVLSFFLLASAFCISMPIPAQTLCMVSSSLDGVLFEGSGSAAMDFGVAGQLSLQAGVSLAVLDLLEPERVAFTYRGGMSLDTSLAFSLAFGDLSGIPAIRLLLDPHGFPAGSSIQSLQEELKITPISFDPADESTLTVGLATRIPLGSDATIFPFCFTPLLQKGNSRGGGAQAILHSPTGLLTLGACFAGRSLGADPGDELFYGAYPSWQGLFLQLSIIMHPHGFSLPVVGTGEWVSRFQVFSMLDSSLGQGVSYSSHVGIKNEACSLTWDIQHLPIVMGSPVIGEPQVDTSILQEMKLELASAAGPMTVLWRITEKIWRPSPYASDHQKRMISTYTSLDFTKAEVSIGVDLRMDASWKVNGMLVHTGSLDLHFGLEVDDVRMLWKPSCAVAADSELELKLDCTIERRFHNGIVLEAAIYSRDENVRIVLGAVYEREDTQVKVMCDSLRKVSLSLTIGR